MRANPLLLATIGHYASRNRPVKTVATSACDAATARQSATARVLRRRIVGMAVSPAGLPGFVLPVPRPNPLLTVTRAKDAAAAGTPVSFRNPMRTRRASSRTPLLTSDGSPRSADSSPSPRMSPLLLTSMRAYQRLASPSASGSGRPPSRLLGGRIPRHTLGESPLHRQRCFSSESAPSV